MKYNNMKYNNIIKAEFLRRPNRFIAEVKLGGENLTVHVKNTGRCRELLTRGAAVYLEKADNFSRKTAYDLVAVEKIRKNGEKILVNMDSQAPNKIAAEWIPISGLFSQSAKIRREVKYGNSRFDLMVNDSGKDSFIEVKGVTLEENGVAMFPDAPTERGVKHLRELISAVKEGYGAAIIFIIQMKGVSAFRPNGKTHPEFAETLREAAENGVKLYAVDSLVTPDSVVADSLVEIEL